MSATSRRLVLTTASTIAPKAVRWAWKPLLPLGKLTLLAGQQGLGKSVLVVNMAAGATTGTLPGDLIHERGDVLIASAEDDPEDTIVPRLIAASADRGRVHLMDMREEHDDGALPGDISLPDDVPAIADAVARLREEGRPVRLVVLDPVLAYLGHGLAARRAEDVRRALGPLVALAAEHDLAVLVIAHLNKDTGDDPLRRIAESGAFTQLTRSVLLFGADPQGEGDDDPRRVLALVKTNIAPPGSHALGFSVATATVEHEGERIPTARMEPTGRHTATAADLLADRQERGARADAREFLSVYLKDGPRSSQDAYNAARVEGIAKRTLERAKTELAVRSSRPGGRGAWRWELPRPTPPPGDLGAIGDLGTATSPGSPTSPRTRGGDAAQNGHEVARAEALLARHPDLAGGAP